MLCDFSTCYIASDEPAQTRESGSFETAQCYVIFLLVASAASDEPAQIRGSGSFETAQCYVM